MSRRVTAQHSTVSTCTCTSVYMQGRLRLQLLQVPAMVLSCVARPAIRAC